MRTRVLRDYEVSVWSLQDSFLAVLKPYGVDIKGLIQNPKLTIKDDGTEEFTFSIPLKYVLNGEKIENPLWKNTTNGIIVLDLRKLKVILNKLQQNEHVFEFMIIKVSDKHEKDQIACEVNCEGLAFHELGKIGYKISLNTDLTELEWRDYYNSPDTNTSENSDDGPPTLTLLYWNNKIFTENSAWKYEIRMNYGMRVGNGYESDKVYEDDYVSSWQYDNNSHLVVAREIGLAREKCRSIDVKESNIYNITLELAKTFEVFCRYEYEHDSNYYITGRKVIYYNNFINEGEELIDITYPYTLGSITRSRDATDLVTKMYVGSADNDDNTITIMNSSSNRMREDYILNFDYLKARGDLTPEQISAIEEYQNEMFRLNSAIIPLLQESITLTGLLPEREAALTVLNNALDLDDEQILAADDFLNEITNNTGYISVTELNPKIGVIISANNERTIKITEHGVEVATLHVYGKYNQAPPAGSPRLDDEKTFTPLYDEFGELIRIRLAPETLDPIEAELNNSNSYCVYMTYKYSPYTYHEKVKEIWVRRKAKDTSERDKAAQEVESIETRVEVISLQILELLAEKNLIMTRFERLMGPALREGYWSSDDYKDYGDHYSAKLSTQEGIIAYTELGTNNIKQKFNYLDDSGLEPITQKFLYDREAFDGEQLSYVDNFSNPDLPIYYPCIRITKNPDLLNFVADHWNELSVIFCDVTDENKVEEEQFRRDQSEFLLGYHINSKCQYAFAEIEEGQPELVIIVTGPIDDNLPGRLYAALIGKQYPNPDSTKPILNEYVTASPRLGIIDWTIKDKVEYSQPISESDWANVNSSDVTTNVAAFINEYNIIYPRIQINSLDLKTAHDELFVKYNGLPLEEYQDYTVLLRDSSYFISVMPAVFAHYGINKLLEVGYAISNANTAIYLDALKVAKENAYPKVEYDAKISTVNKDFIDNVYNMLGRIANINDSELAFRNVQGYLSELELSLDKPQDDNIKVKNYKTKFEDLFSSIVALTAQMQKNGPVFSTIANGFNTDGTLSEDVMLLTLNRVNLDYAFANGKLTISEADGIWAKSDSGVVAIRGGGIFTSTSPKNPEKTEWNWNTGITPEGINANLITTGLLDTNLIKIYAGDNVKLQMNAGGLYAYRDVSGVSVSEDLVTTTDEQVFATLDGLTEEEVTELLNRGNIDTKLYVIHNDLGLFLRLENGAILNNKKYNIQSQDSTYLDRVAISWDGLTLRNYLNERVFFADANTGDLEITGKITATSGAFHGDIYANSFLINNASSFLINNKSLATYVEDSINTNVPNMITAQTREVNITSDLDVFIGNVNNASGTVITPTTITLTANRKGISNNIAGQWYYKDSEGFKPINGRTETTLEVVGDSTQAQYDSKYWHDLTATFKYEVTQDGQTYSDIKSIYFISNGRNGKDGNSFTILGTKASIDDLPKTGNNTGDAYIVNGILWVWPASGIDWENAGAVLGVSITSVVESYTTSTSANASQAELTGWASFSEINAPGKPQWNATNKYLWNQEAINYSDSSYNTTTAPHIVAIYTVDGTNGVGISNIIEHYKVSNNNLSAPTGTWYSSISAALNATALSATNPYLWGYETIEYTNNTSKNTDKRIISYYTESPIIYELLLSEPIVITNGTTYTPSSITLSAKKKTGDTAYINYAGKFKIKDTASYLNDSAVSSYSYEINSDNKIIFELYDSTGNQLLDSLSLTIIGDGAPGQNGTSPYNVILTNENCSFPAGTVGNATCDIMVYKGTEKLSLSIGTITHDNGLAGLPTGMSIDNPVSISNNVATLSIHTTNTFNSNGELNIPVTADGLIFNMKLTYSVVGIGEKGDAGADGYTVFLTNENHSFAADTNGKLFTTTITTQAKVYKGTELQTSVTIGYPNNTVFGNRITTVSNTTDTAQIAVDYTNNPLTLNANGTIDFTITCGTTTFIRTLSYQINKAPDTITSSETLYYLKTPSGLNPSMIPDGSPAITSNTDGTDSWKVIIPSYVNNGVYYTCELYHWKSGNITWTSPIADARINTALAAASITDLISANGIAGPGTWGTGTNAIDYALLLGSSSLDKPMLIASNSGIVIAKPATENYGAAVTINSAGISMTGATMNLSANSSFSIAGGNITLTANNNTNSNIIMNGGAINLTGGAIDLTSYLHEDGTSIYKREKFTLDENGLILWYSSASEDNATAYNNEENTTAKIILDENGINVTGKKIEIDGKDVWSRGDIIIMNPNISDGDPEDWRKSVSTIETHMAGLADIKDWVLIRPVYNAESVYTATINGGTNTALTKQDTYYFGNNANWYKYTIKCSALAFSALSGSGTPSYSARLDFYFSNTRLTDANYTDAPILKAITNLSVGDDGSVNNNDTWNLFHNLGITIQDNTNNLCKEDSILYCYVKATSRTLKRITFSLTCTCDATISRVPCTVYYYPEASS